VTVEANRRNFYRIKDTAAVEIHPSLGQSDSFADLVQLPAQYQLISDFQLLDVEAQSLLGTIQEKDRSLAAYLRLLNRKLDALSRTLALVNHPIDPKELREIDLSEGGLSLHWPNALEPTSLVRIKLILVPSYVGLLLRGQVVTCKNRDNGFDIHLEFIDLDDQQRQLIARHILRKQQEERRQRPVE